MKHAKTTRAVTAERRTSSPPAARTIAARAAKAAEANRLAALAAAVITAHRAGQDIDTVMAREAPDRQTNHIA